MTGDRALIARLAAGDEAAFEQFFGDYFPRLYRFARVRLGRDEDAAEEVVQAVMITAFRKIHTYRGDAALFTWLCTLCRHEIAKWLERDERAGTVSLVEDEPLTRATLETLASLTGDNPETQFDLQELARLVQVTLDHLPPRYGDALEWKYLQGLTIQEIAERLGVGEKAVESLLTRARQAFRDGFPGTIAKVR
jgi:RNA polymerase sigma-70 factor (ECF subfamily)